MPPHWHACCCCLLATLALSPASIIPAPTTGPFTLCSTNVLLHAWHTTSMPGSCPPHCLHCFPHLHTYAFAGILVLHLLASLQLLCSCLHICSCLLLFCCNLLASALFAATSPASLAATCLPAFVWAHLCPAPWCHLLLQFLAHCPTGQLHLSRLVPPLRWCSLCHPIVSALPIRPFSGSVSAHTTSPMFSGPSPWPIPKPWGFAKPGIS